MSRTSTNRNTNPYTHTTTHTPLRWHIVILKLKRKGTFFNFFIFFETTVMYFLVPPKAAMREDWVRGMFYQKKKKKVTNNFSMLLLLCEYVGTQRNTRKQKRKQSAYLAKYIREKEFRKSTCPFAASKRGKVPTSSYACLI